MIFSQRKKKRQNRNLSQRKPKKKGVGQKRQYSKSHRIPSRSKLSQSKNTNIRGSVLLDKLMSKKPKQNQQRKVPFQPIVSSQRLKQKKRKNKTKTKKQKQDPFAIDMPTNFQSPVNIQRITSKPHSSHSSQLCVYLVLLSSLFKMLFVCCI